VNNKLDIYVFIMVVVFWQHACNHWYGVCS